jgi:hypothetical protein
VGLRMIQPWTNPRSKYYWFRRRVPQEYLEFGMPSEIKFSLGTNARDEAVLRCQEENVKLERQWRAGLIGTPPDDLSHLQIVALAGEFYREMAATHRDEPGPAIAFIGGDRSQEALRFWSVSDASSRGIRRRSGNIPAKTRDLPSRRSNRGFHPGLRGSQGARLERVDAQCEPRLAAGHDATLGSTLPTGPAQAAAGVVAGFIIGAVASLPDVAGGELLPPTLAPLSAPTLCLPGVRHLRPAC